MVAGVSNPANTAQFGDRGRRLGETNEHGDEAEGVSSTAVCHRLHTSQRTYGAP